MTLAFALFALLAAAPAVEWRPEDPANREVVEVTGPSLRGALAAIGAAEVPAAKPRPDMILAQFPDGSRMILNLKPCGGDGPACQKLLLVSVFEVPPGLGPEPLKEARLSYLARSSFVSLSLPEGRAPMMMRSVVSDFGIQRGNLYMELVSFAKHVQQFRQELNAAAKP